MGIDRTGRSIGFGAPARKSDFNHVMTGFVRKARFLCAIR
jgi:hypothetical protein